VVIAAESMGVSQLLGAHALAALTKSTPMFIVQITTMMVTIIHIVIIVTLHAQNKLNYIT